MKKLLFLPLVFLFFQSQNLFATHIAGIEIYYEYIGDSTNTSYEYEVTLILYRYTGGAGLGTTQNVNIGSSCFSSNNLTVHRFVPTGLTQNQNGGVYIPNFNECSDSSISMDYMEAHYYRESVVLPGTCADFRFSYSTCCRNGQIVNLVNPSSQSMYAESLLNNTIGPNSSPVIQSAAVKAFCAGYEMHWPQSAVEDDGDSLYYRLAQPLDDRNTFVDWTSNYSTTQPIYTSTGVFFNSQNGDFIFTPVGPQIGVVKFIIEEYRRDSVLGPQFIGTTERELQYIVTANCNTTASQVNLSQPSLDSGFTKLNCAQEIVTLNLTQRINCNSIAPDGSDFALLNSQNNLVPIVAAGTDSCDASFSRSLWLELDEPISYNDTLTLVSRMGNDQNTLITACGFSMNENESINYFVESCTTGVGLEKIEVPAFNVYPNPAREVLNIEYLSASGSREIYILNLQGQILRKFAAEMPVNEFDISDLPRGSYLVKSKDGQDSETLAFQKL